MGFERVTSSLELRKEELGAMARTAGEKEVIIHGPMPMIVSRHCVIGAVLGKNQAKVPCGYSCYGNTFYLKDRMGMMFPVVGDRYHNMNLYNCKDLCLIDELDHLSHFQVWRIEGQFYDIGSLKEIIKLYRAARNKPSPKEKGNIKRISCRIGTDLFQSWIYQRSFYRGVKT